MISWLIVAIAVLFIVLLMADGILRMMIFATGITNDVIDAVDD